MWYDDTIEMMTLWVCYESGQGLEKNGETHDQCRPCHEKNVMCGG